MLTTHVGSLPFLDIADALDYTFKFDIPVLFTLPMLDEKQFIQNEIEAVSKRGLPFYYKEFLKRAKAKKIKKIKYQLVGPISFLQTHPDMIPTFDLDDFVGIHNRMISLLLQDFELLYVVDEPCLKANDVHHSELLNSFYKRIIKHNDLEVFIHCCNQLDLEFVKSLPDLYFHLDLSLFRSIQLPLNCSVFVGLGDLTNTRYQLDQKKLPNDIQYISPGCGLAFNNIKDLELIYNLLIKFKHRFS